MARSPYKPRGKPITPEARRAFFKMRSLAGKKAAISRRKAKLSMEFHKP